jgi:hypothetical protein
MRTPLQDNKHIYYCQINLPDELSVVDVIDDLEMIGIHHILRVKYIHNKGELSKKEMYKYCNAFDIETQKKVDKVWTNFLDKTSLDVLIKSIIEKSNKAKKSVSKRITNDTTNDVTKDVSNDTTNDVSKEKDKDKDKVKEKDIYKPFSFSLKKNCLLENTSSEYMQKLKEYIEAENRGMSYQEFYDSCELKGYKYKNFKLAYNKWNKKEEVKENQEYVF